MSTASLRVAQLETSLVVSAERIAQLEEFVRVQGQSQATKLENLEQVNSEVTRLRGLIEVMQFDLETMKKNSDQYQLAQERRQLFDERRLTKLEGFLGVKPPPPPTAEELGLASDTPLVDPTLPVGETPVEPVPPEGTDDPVPATVKGKLELAANHLAEGRPAVARAVLVAAKTAHPTAPELPEIAYRTAETFLAERDFGKAALAFKRVIDDHPGSAWAPWSMLGQGACFEGLNQKDNARLFYDGVIQRFPKSDAAKEAKKRLGR